MNESLRRKIYDVRKRQEISALHINPNFILQFVHLNFAIANYAYLQLTSENICDMATLKLAFNYEDLSLSRVEGLNLTPTCLTPCQGAIDGLTLI